MPVDTMAISSMAYRFEFFAGPRLIAFGHETARNGASRSSILAGAQQCALAACTLGCQASEGGDRNYTGSSGSIRLLVAAWRPPSGALYNVEVPLGGRVLCPKRLRGKTLFSNNIVHS